MTNAPSALVETDEPQTTSVASYQGDIDSDGDVVPFRVAVRDGVSSDAVDRLESAGNIEITDPVNAQAMIIRSKTKLLTDERFDEHPELMMVARAGVGVDNIDMGLASKHGVATINTPGASTTAVAQRAIAFALGHASRIKQGTQAFAEGKWAKKDKTVKPVNTGVQTLGILGYGRIGQATARLAEPFFNDVIFTDERDMDGKVDLETLLERSDVLSVHTGGSEEILGTDELALMKPGALIVNTSRGVVINIRALLGRMDDGVHAALDVFPEEGDGMFSNSDIEALVKHPNFTGTPHTAASDVDTQKQLGLEGARRIQQFAQQGIVNPEDIPGHTLPKIIPGGLKAAGIRAVLMHRSTPGTLEKITGAVAGLGKNISATTNAEGPMNGSTKLAMTAVDVEDVSVDDALKIMDAIEEVVDVQKKRLMSFVV